MANRSTNRGARFQSTRRGFLRCPLPPLCFANSQSCACGNKFDVTHAMVCPKRRFPTIRHNEVRGLTANLLTEVCHDVETEPKLQVLNGECFSFRTANMEDGARLDMKNSWFGGQQYAMCIF